jgi:D-alanine-D-alanine ligase-like ATP-grasp enzyme
MSQKKKNIFGGISIASIALLLVLLFTSMGGGEVSQPSSTQRQNAINENIASEVLNNVGIPDTQFYLEAKTVKDWFEYWDNDMRVSYVYVFMSGTPIGYYVIKGKPVSTRSYLNPEEKYYMNGATIQTPSLDGTYGEDNVGWRMFTAYGVPIAVEGVGATIMYSSEKITVFNVPDLTPAGK